MVWTSLTPNQTYTLPEAAEQLNLSETILVRLSQYFRIPAQSYDTEGWLSFKGELEFTNQDLHFLREARELVLAGESLESVKAKLMPNGQLPVAPSAAIDIPADEPPPQPTQHPTVLETTLTSTSVKPVAAPFPAMPSIEVVADSAAEVDAQESSRLKRRTRHDMPTSPRGSKRPERSQRRRTTGTVTPIRPDISSEVPTSHASPVIDVAAVPPVEDPPPVQPLQELAYQLQNTEYTESLPDEGHEAVFYDLHGQAKYQQLADQTFQHYKSNTRQKRGTFRNLANALTEPIIRPPRARFPLFHQQGGKPLQQKISPAGAFFDFFTSLFQTRPIPSGMPQPTRHAAPPQVPQTPQALKRHLNLELRQHARELRQAVLREAEIRNSRPVHSQKQHPATTSRQPSFLS